MVEHRHHQINHFDGSFLCCILKADARWISQHILGALKRNECKAAFQHPQNVHHTTPVVPRKSYGNKAQQMTMSQLISEGIESMVNGADWL